MPKRIVLIAILLVAVAAVGFFGYRYFNGKKATPARSAVFMSNGQVYFGYLSNFDKSTVTLKDVYYLKTEDLASADKRILLVKMGNELHNPENTMHINRDQILFYQDIKDNSKVNDAISRFVSGSTDSLVNPPAEVSPIVE